MWITCQIANNIIFSVFFKICKSWFLLYVFVAKRQLKPHKNNSVCTIVNEITRKLSICSGSRNNYMFLILKLNLHGCVCSWTNVRYIDDHPVPFNFFDILQFYTNYTLLTVIDFGYKSNENDCLIFHLTFGRRQRDFTVNVMASQFVESNIRESYP